MLLCCWCAQTVLRQSLVNQRVFDSELERDNASLKVAVRTVKMEWNFLIMKQLD